MKGDDPPLAAERADPDDASPTSDFTRGTRRVACATCGSAIDPTAWHPVATRTDDDDEFHLLVFCSVECRSTHERP